jgi:hypothetical protein
MAKKTYIVARGVFVSGKPGSEIKHRKGERISLDEADGARLVAVGDVEPAPAPPKAASSALPKTLLPVDGRDETLEVPGSDQTVTVEAVLRSAFEASGMTVTAWNALGEEEIERRMKSALEAMAKG